MEGVGRHIHAGPVKSAKACVDKRGGASLKNIVLILMIASIAATPATARPVKLVRPPNGTYVYSMHQGKGPAIFQSTILVKGSGSTFSISEKTKLPNGAVATTQSTWSSATLLPLTFDVYQGKTTVHARLTATKVTFIDMPDSFARITGTACILPSVGLISTDLMFAYFLNAHPGESLTLAEIQNNQTVLVRRSSASPAAVRRGDNAAIDITKQGKHGEARDQEHVVAWLSRRSSIIDEVRATPGDARISLLHYARSER